MCNGLGSEVGGTAVGVLADSLLKTSTLVKWREGLIAGNLVLISPFYPGYVSPSAMRWRGINIFIALLKAQWLVRAGHDR